MNRSYPIPAATFAVGVFSGALALAGYQTLSETEARVPPAAAAVPVSVPPSHPIQAVQSAEKTAAPEADAAAMAGPVSAGSKEELEVRLEGMAAGWSRLETEVQRLRARMVQLERRLPAVATAGGGDDETVPRARTPEDRRTALETAGIDRRRAEDIVWRQGQYELDQLELRDQAMREGWIATDRYRDELTRLEEARVDMRAELGDEAFDRYLYAAGEDNRLRIDTVIAGSAAEGAGLQSGDLIESYDGARVFSVGELREVTAQGERGESIAVTVRRADGTPIQAWLPRGPLGVHLEQVRMSPDS